MFVYILGVLKSMIIVRPSNILIFESTDFCSFITLKTSTFTACKFSKIPKIFMY